MSKTDNKSDEVAWKYLLRQLLVCSGVLSCMFMSGLNFGLPTVLIPQLQRESNSTDTSNAEMGAWLYTILNYCATPWIVLLPICESYAGRKTTHGAVGVIAFIGFLISYCSTHITHIVISLVFHGVVDSYVGISMITISEFISSKYRGVLLTLQFATFFWGIFTANTIGTFFYWKNISIVGLVCAIYSSTVVLFWPESPFWLAEKARFDQCAKSHRWLKGSNMESEKELEKLVARHQNVKRKTNVKAQVSEMLKAAVNKEFYRAMLFSILMIAVYVCSGKIVSTLFALDIFKKITNSESTAYSAMLILDAVTLVTMYVGCALVRVCKRRTLLLISSSIAITCLYLLSLYLYLVKLSIVTEDQYISLFLLVSYSIAIACGPMIVSSSIVSEISPFKAKGLFMTLVILFSKISLSTLTGIMPYFFKNIQMHGTFLVFASSSSVCLLLLYLYLPETKDKTLQEISDCIKGVKPVSEDFFLPMMSNDKTLADEL